MLMHKKHRILSEMNVVPYIDVMLVLLVIFMITAPLLSQGVRVNLPQTNAKPLPTDSEGPIIVSIDSQGLYYLNVAAQNDVPITLENLAPRITAELTVSKEKGKERAVLVKADRNIFYGKVVTLMALLQNAGVEKVGLMTENLK